MVWSSRSVCVPRTSSAAVPAFVAARGRPLIVRSWSSASLFAGDGLDAYDSRRHIANMWFLVFIAEGADIVCTQESHGAHMDYVEFGDFMPGWTVAGSHLRDGVSCGIFSVVAGYFADIPCCIRRRGGMWAHWHSKAKRARLPIP